MTNPVGINITAGPDATICAGSTYELNSANASNATSILWTTSGTGSFSDATVIHPIYTPSSNDILDGYVNLTLHAGSSTSCTSTDVMILTIHPQPAISSCFPDATICKGSSTQIGIIALSNCGGCTYTYNWTSNPTGFTSTISNPIVSPLITTVYTLTVTNTTTTCSIEKTVTVTVNPLGQIVDPTDIVICNNSVTSATFTTDNIGGTTSYLWANNQTSIGLAASGAGNLTAFTALNSSTAPVIATIVVTPNYTYNDVSCVGSAENFTITVNPTGQTNQPSSLILCNGESTSLVNFSTINTGGTTTYSWANNTTSIGLVANGTGNISSFAAINTGTSPVVATLVVTPHYTNEGVTCDGPTKSFTITVNPTAEVEQSSNQVLCNGSNTSLITFNTINTLGTTTYSWTNSATSIGLPSNGTGNITSFTAVNMETTPVVATIVVTPHYTNDEVTCNGPTMSFTITVNPTGEVEQPSNQVLCNGSGTNAVIFSSINTMGTTTYSWTNTTSSIGLGASGSGDIASFIAINTSTVPVIATVVITPHLTNDGVTCDGPTKSFTITVNPTAEIEQSSNQVLCNGSNTSLVTFNTINTLGTTTYSWTNSATSIGLPFSGTGNITSFTAVNIGTIPVVANIVVTPHYTNDEVTCDGPTENFTITVNPTGEVEQPLNLVFCNGSSTNIVNFTSISTGGITTYSWTNNNTIIGLGASGTGDIGSFVAVNIGTAPIVATISVTPHFTNDGITCDGPSKSFTITTNPSGQLNDPTDQIVCNGLTTTLVSFSTQNTIGTTTYTWVNNTTSIGLAANGTGNIPSFTAINSLTVPVVATIVVTPHFTFENVSCVGTNQSFTIQVNPTPTPVINGANSSCSHTITQYCDVDTVSGNYSYQWSVSGGSIFSGANTSCIDVVWNNNCSSGWVTLTKINTLTGCITTTDHYDVTIHPRPTPTVIGNLNVNSGTFVTYYTNNVNGNLYSWSVIGGDVESGQGTASIVVHWGSCVNCTLGSITVLETTPYGCTASSTINVSINIFPGVQKLSGQLTYDNIYDTPLNGVSIQLIKDGFVIGTTTTGTGIDLTGNPVLGYYVFDSIPYGDYSLHVSSTKPWGGITAIDALLIKLHAIGNISLVDLPLVAADVNASSTINATDALLVQLRIVGLVNQWGAGDWKFNNSSFTFSATNTTYNFKAICVGDVNKSYMPTGLKHHVSTNDGVMDIQPNTPFTYTIKCNSSANLGAMTLFMNYDNSLFEIQKVNDVLDGMQYKIENGQIAFAWASLQARNVNIGDTIISLQMKAISAISQPTAIFNYGVNSEFGDESAMVVNNFELKMADVQSVNNDDAFAVNSYPNPAEDITNIVYNLPENGKVKITITNILGQPVSTLLDEEQSKGTHKIVVNAAQLSLSTGVYMYQVEVNGTTTHYIKINRIVFER